MKLGLGTVQFGLDYGISNCSGKTPESEVRKILQLAVDSGVRVLDTATGYGDSEEVLGRVLPMQHPFSIVTKTPASCSQELGGEFVDRVRESFCLSLSKLGQKKVYAVLVHRAEDLLSTHGDRLMDALLEFRQRGMVEKVGVSVYSGVQIDAILERYPVELVQLPVNVLDQRLIASGHIAQLKCAGIEVHARSAFLQGLLLMSLAAVPGNFAPIRGHLESYHAYIESLGLTPLQAALGFVLGQSELDRVILGVNTAQQFSEVLAGHMTKVDVHSMARFALSDISVLDPSQWQLNTP